MKKREKHIIKVILITLGLLTMCSCVTNYSTTYLQKRIKKEYAEYNETNSEYRLQKKDEVIIRLFTTNDAAAKLFGGSSTNMNNQYSYKIYEDGTIDLPYLKKVKIEGMTIRECEKFLSKALKDYINNDVFVKISLYKRVYYVLGESGKGEFPYYKDQLNIFEALAAAGDLGVQADRKKIKLLRIVNGKEKILEFDIRSRDIVDSEYYYIRPNDIIYVPQTKGSFFKITSFGSFVGVITSSLSFVLLVLQYATQK